MRSSLVDPGPGEALRVLSGGVVLDDRRGWRPWAADMAWAASLRPEAARPVWHCALRTAPVDRLLPDPVWAAIATAHVQAMGLAGFLWVAVRHGPDHIHVVARRVDERGRLWRDGHDYARAMRSARVLEHTFGLTPLPAVRPARPGRFRRRPPRLARRRRSPLRTGPPGIPAGARSRPADLPRVGVPPRRSPVPAGTGPAGEGLHMDYKSSHPPPGPGGRCHRLPRPAPPRTPPPLGPHPQRRPSTPNRPAHATQQRRYRQPDTTPSGWCFPPRRGDWQLAPRLVFRRQPHHSVPTDALPSGVMASRESIAESFVRSSNTGWM
jgi:hypothetical protein